MSINLPSNLLNKQNANKKSCFHCNDTNLGYPGFEHILMLFILIMIGEDVQKTSP